MKTPYEQGVESGRQAVLNPEITPEAVEAGALQSIQSLQKYQEGDGALGLIKEQEQWLQGRIYGAKGAAQ